MNGFKINTYTQTGGILGVDFVLYPWFFAYQLNERFDGLLTDNIILSLLFNSSI